MPIINVEFASLDGSAKEEIEVTLTKMPNFTTIKRSDMNELKQKFVHTNDKRFYMQRDHQYPMHLIIGDSTFYRIKTEKIYKGELGVPVVEGTSFGWVVHDGDPPDDDCMYYQMFYSLDVLGVEGRGEDDQSAVYAEFNETIVQNSEGRYEVNIHWIPGAQLTETNEAQSKKRLRSVAKKLKQDLHLEAEYQNNIIAEQLRKEIIEKVPENQTGSRVYTTRPISR